MLFFFTLFLSALYLLYLELSWKTITLVVATLLFVVLEDSWRTAVINKLRRLEYVVDRDVHNVGRSRPRNEGSVMGMNLFVPVFTNLEGRQIQEVEDAYQVEITPAEEGVTEIRKEQRLRVTGSKPAIQRFLRALFSK